MSTESTDKPRFFPEDFETEAIHFLHECLGITVNDITHNNCRDVYCKLVEVLNCLLTLV